MPNEIIDFQSGLFDFEILEEQTLRKVVHQ